MKNINKKILIETIIWLSVVVVMIMGILFLRSNIKSMSADMRAERSSLAEIAFQLETYAAMRDVYNRRASSYLDLMKERVPSQAQIINLPREIQFLASQAGVSIATSFADETPPGQQLGSIGIRIDTTGSLDNIVEFVNLLRRFPVLSVIDNVSLEKDGEKYTSVIRIRVFFGG